MSKRCFSVGMVLSVFFLVLFCGCDADTGSSFSADGGLASRPDGGFGATQGGVQDMGLARELITSGMVPPPEAFTVEGMFSEHDLPLTGDTNEAVLNLRGGLAVAPDLAGETGGWIQVGMSSNITPETFERPTLSIIACVDVSGSMGWGYSGENTEYPRPGYVARLLLSKIAAQLNAEDRIAIVTYGSEVTTLLDPTVANNPAVVEAIASLSTNGSTNMEAGLIRAYAVARQELDAHTDDVRIMLFTDIQPNVGNTSGQSFRALAAEGADDSIGLTVFGLGVGMGQEIMNVISDLWSGNAFSLFNDEDVTETMELSWPWMVSPIAHNLTLEIFTPAGIRIESAFGFPGGCDQGLGFTVASVFPSQRKGALLALLKPEPGNLLNGVSLTGKLSFEALDGTSISQNLNWTFPVESIPEAEMWYDQSATGKTVALAMLVSGMKNAALEYGQDPASAIETMQLVCTRIVVEAEILEDEGLRVEVDLANNLLALMEAGAEQGDLYGEY